MRIMERWEKLQIVFLVDVNAPPDGNVERYCRSISLACTRILLVMSDFPNKEHLKLKWSYKLFSSERPYKSLGENISMFHELSSELLDTFTSDLTSCVSGECVGNTITSPRHRQQLQVSNWTRSLYNVLAGAVQDFAWDAPDIKSPMPLRTRQGKTKRSFHKPVIFDSKMSAKLRNLIFLFSSEPLGTFASSAGGNAMVDKIFPKPLLSQLSCKGISVHWVFQEHRLEQDMLEVLAKTLGATGGSLLPVSVLLPLMRGLSSVTSPSGVGASQKCDSKSRKGRGGVALDLVLPISHHLKDTLESSVVKEQGRKKMKLLWLCSKGESIKGEAF